MCPVILQAILYEGTLWRNAQEKQCAWVTMDGLFSSDNFNLSEIQRFFICMSLFLFVADYFALLHLLFTCESFIEAETNC